MIERDHAVMRTELDMEAFNASVLEVTMQAQQQGAEITKLEESLAISRQTLQNLESVRDNLLTRWMDEVAQQPALYGASYYLDERSKKDIANLSRMHARGEFLCTLAARAHQSALPVLAIKKTNDAPVATKGTQVREAKEPVIGFSAQLGETASDMFRIERDIDAGTPKALHVCLQKVIKIESVLDSRAAADGAVSATPRTVRAEYAEVSMLDRNSNSPGVPSKLVFHEDGEPKEIDIKSPTNIYIGEMAVRNALLAIISSVSDRKHDQATLRTITDEIAR